MAVKSLVLDLLDHFNHGVLLVDDSLHIVACNIHMGSFLSTSGDQALGKEVNQCLVGFSGSILEEAVQRSFSDGMAQIISSILHPELNKLFPLTGKDGKHFALRILVSSVQAEAEGEVLSMIQFIFLMH